MKLNEIYNRVLFSFQIVIFIKGNREFDGTVIVSSILRQCSSDKLNGNRAINKSVVNNTK